MILLTEQQYTEAIRACEGIEAALDRQQKALENIVRIFENMAAGRDPNDGLHKFENA